ncbi:cytochrome-ba3 oxidase subunit [Natronorubrum aibiense]|uniref:Cytochrome-ba3 oxidase subunit n=1 Tax=Natronorubrum aibiense TaxID=348826 RepID=A0A5P9NZF7_9EURY|nr:cytochrome-ba3 oxidase subunit [Natronorubrum aibiense]QFU81136.1 cytochrome-ba3 oxidase subunit [Natronorubrum aibiense]
MVLEDASPRVALVAGLLALLPVLSYALWGSLPAGAISAINVLIIITSLYIAFSPLQEPHVHGSAET